MGGHVGLDHSHTFRYTHDARRRPADECLSNLWSRVGGHDRPRHLLGVGGGGNVTEGL